MAFNETIPGKSLTANMLTQGGVSRSLASYHSTWIPRRRPSHFGRLTFKLTIEYTLEFGKRTQLEFLDFREQAYCNAVLPWNKVNERQN